MEGVWYDTQMDIIYGLLFIVVVVFAFGALALSAELFKAWLVARSWRKIARSYYATVADRHLENDG